MSERILTPDEMLDGVRDRIFKIANMVITTFPPLPLIVNEKYKFTFDSTMIYIYKGKQKLDQYPDGYCHLFEREDGEVAKATKYYHSIENV